MSDLENFILFFLLLSNFELSQDFKDDSQFTTHKAFIFKAGFTCHSIWSFNLFGDD